MGLRDAALSAAARQLGRPSGLPGRVVGRLLNRGNRALVAAAVAAGAPAPGSTAADIGFGGGGGLDLLLDRVEPSGLVHGVEISPTMLAQARRRFRRDLREGCLQLHEAPLERLPLPDAAVDVVVSTNTIYFVPDLDAAARELARVLRPGGRLALGINDPESMAKLPFTAHGFILRPVDEVTEHLRRAGFSLVEDRRAGAAHVIVADIPASTASGG